MAGVKGELTFKLDGNDKSFIVKELTARQILGIFDKKNINVDSLTFAKIREIFGKKVLPVASNITEEELLDLLPSDIDVIWEKFKAVNSVFFRTARQLNKVEVVEQIKTALVQDFLNAYAKLLKQGTAKD